MKHDRLVGRHFLDFAANGGMYEGEILQRLAPGIYLVKHDDAGGPFMNVVPVSEMQGWRFDYHTAAAPATTPL